MNDQRWWLVRILLILSALALVYATHGCSPAG